MRKGEWLIASAGLGDEGELCMDGWEPFAVVFDPGACPPKGSPHTRGWMIVFMKKFVPAKRRKS